MRQRLILTLLCASTSGCDFANHAAKHSAVAAQTRFGTECGIDDLQYKIVQSPKPTLVLAEPKTSGHLEFPDNHFEPVPVSAREQHVMDVFPCLELLAAKRGLAIDYPATMFVN